MCIPSRHSIQCIGGPFQGFKVKPFLWIPSQEVLRCAIENSRRVLIISGLLP